MEKKDSHTLVSNTCFKHMKTPACLARWITKDTPSGSIERKEVGSEIPTETKIYMLPRGVYHVTCLIDDTRSSWLHQVLGLLDGNFFALIFSILKNLHQNPRFERLFELLRFSTNPLSAIKCLGISRIIKTLS